MTRKGSTAPWYADLAWDLKRVITHEKGPYDCAQVAIDSYLESSQSDLYTQSIEGVHWRRCALSLSLSIADKERTRYIVYVILEFYGRVGTPQLLSAEKGRNIAADLKEMSVQVEIKKSGIDEQVESLMGSGDLETSLMKIAQTFIPRPKEAREFLEK